MADPFNDTNHHQPTQRHSENVIRPDDDRSSIALRFAHAQSPSNCPESHIIPRSERSTCGRSAQLYHSSSSIPASAFSMQALFWQPVRSAPDHQEPGRSSWERPPSPQMCIVSGDLDLDVPMVLRRISKRDRSIYCSLRGGAWPQGCWYFSIFAEWCVSFLNRYFLDLTIIHRREVPEEITGAMHQRHTEGGEAWPTPSSGPCRGGYRKYPYVLFEF